MSIKNKIAIVTESGSGIGKQIAIDFAKEGCNIVVASLISDQADQSI
jgi:NAD(P)-dependent dehydrogenase (short-subunit alcohol dehydrogenase family)